MVTIPISRLLSGIPALTVSNMAAIRKTDLSPSMDDIEFERDRPRRIKTLSAVGLESKLQSLIFARRTLEGRLVRMIKKTQELMSSALNKSAVLERLDQISTTFQAFQDTHAELLEIAESSNHQLNDDDEARYFERIDEEVFQLKQQAHNWTRDLEGRSSSQPASRTPSVKSQISRRSSRCSVYSTSSFKERMVEEKIKIAELETEASLQRERESVRSAIARLDLEEEIRVRKATAHILEEASTQQPPSLREAKPNADQLQQQRRTFPVAEVLPEQPSEPEVRTLYQQDFSTTNPFRDMLPSNPTFFSTHERLPLHIPNDIAAQPMQNKPSPEDSSVTKLLCQMLQQQAAPEVDIESYAGDSLDYHYFVALFDEVVERNILDARGRLTRLIKFTKGEAKELIQHCIQLPPSEGYITARRLLKERYGDPYTVICAYKKQIKNWAPIGETMWQPSVDSTTSSSNAKASQHTSPGTPWTTQTQYARSYQNYRFTSPTNGTKGFSKSGQMRCDSQASITSSNSSPRRPPSSATPCSPGTLWTVAPATNKKVEKSRTTTSRKRKKTN